MIKLNIEGYCENCADFEPVKDDYSMYGPDDMPWKVDIVIGCEHRHRCRNIYNYMCKEKENG